MVVTACVIHLHRDLLHSHYIVFIEEVGAFIAISSLLPCSGASGNLSVLAVSVYIALSRLVLFLATTLSFSTLSQKLFLTTHN